MNIQSTTSNILPAIAFFCTALLACSSTSAQENAQRSAGRFMPPATIACDRNQLTSWTGLVSGYGRGAAKSWIEINTDDDTIESTEIDHHDQTDASASFLLWSKTFTAADWARIEKSPGVLIEGMRATAWICLDGQTPPVIDWQPPQD
jgi:hypothetical protein